MTFGKNSQRNFFIVVVLVAIAGGFAWLASSKKAPGNVATESVGSGSAPAPASVLEVKNSPAPPLPTVSEADTSELGEMKEAIADDPLLNLLPEWLRESGTLHRERIQLGGHWVERVQGRYEWPEGELVEVQISDLGGQATEDLFKSLGFDLDVEYEETDEGVRLVEDGDDFVANMEFSEEGQEGSVQLVVAGRYMMEIQMEGFPFESFQAMEDRDAMFATLREYAAGK